MDPEVVDISALDFPMEELVSCDVARIPDRRWYMVAVAGIPLSILSLLSNVLIAVVLLRSKHSHFFFLAILAISDSFLSLMYGPVIAMDIIKDRVQLLWLTHAYWSYVSPLLALCQSSMTFSTYLIALATIERYLITEKSEGIKYIRNHRGFLAALLFLFALLLRGSAYFEVEMQKNSNCTGHTEFVIGLTELATHPIYNNVFRFYLRTIFTVLVPFFLLALLNVKIVRTLRRQQRAAAMFRFATSRHKIITMSRMMLKVRSATRLMVLIVCSYLTANFLNVVVTIWEYIHFESTQTDEFYVIYEILTDTVSVMYIAVCATRLFVYVSCNEEISHSLESKKYNFRNDITAFICSLRKLADRKNSFVKASSSPGSAKGGTELDSIAVSIARRMIIPDATLSDQMENDEFSPLAAVASPAVQGKEVESPPHAVVMANGYSQCTTNSDEV